MTTHPAQTIHETIHGRFVNAAIHAIHVWGVCAGRAFTASLTAAIHGFPPPYKGEGAVWMGSEPRETSA